MSAERDQERGVFGTPRGLTLGMVALAGLFYGGSSLMWGYWGRALIGLGAMAAALWLAVRLSRGRGEGEEEGVR